LPNPYLLVGPIWLGASRGHLQTLQPASHALFLKQDTQTVLTERAMKDFMRDELGAPRVVDRSAFQTELDALRVREKAHTREGDAIAAARRRLPMVEVDGATPLIGERGATTLLDALGRRRMLIVYYFMWHNGHPAPEQCEGCTWVTSQVRELSYIHSRDVTFAVFCQGPYEVITDSAKLVFAPRRASVPPLYASAHGH
jgi:hypothetical protein